jgi:hypothetical protein
MTDLAAAPTISPRAHDLLTRIDAWSGSGVVRSLLVKIAVAIAGPMLILAGLAMLVLPGPGLVVIALGLAVLAVEYDWARSRLGRLGRILGRAREAALPREASGGRRLLGLLGVAAFVAGGALATTAVTALLGSVAFF